MNTNSNPQESKNPNGIQIIGGIKKALSIVGTALGTFFMVAIITGCIVGSVLTVYILQAMDAEEPVNLESIPLGYTSVIFAYDENGNEIELERLYNPNNNRIWVDLDDISPHVKDALIAIEDKRFYSHQGVDWKRTLAAFINQFVPILQGQAGGSTIHQQLIKNLTGDDAIRVDRKVREIFRALNLAQNYTHDQVLESYLNVVPFGAGTNGIQAASNVYFGKESKDLTLAESAAIVGITKLPGAYNPLLYPVANKGRQEDVLFAMHDQKVISDEEYQKALDETLHFQKTNTLKTTMEPTSYFVDHVIESVISDFVDKEGMTREQAANELYQGGYSIYTTVDIKMQKALEEFYSSEENFPPVNREEYPESACVITDHNGKILALVGGRQEKTRSRAYNRATMAKRQPGSTFKPIGPYALAFEYNLLTPSTIIEDSPTNPGAPTSDLYPRNYYGGYLGPVTVERAIKNSINTVAVKVTEMLTPASLFDFYYYELGITSLVEKWTNKNGDVFSDISVGPMALGGVTVGVTPLEIAGAYQILVNGGNFTKPYAYTKVVSSDGRVVLQSNVTPRQVISEDTSVLLNKMTQEVVISGTGTDARIANMPTGGKTGTSNDNVDQWFVGFTPYYICNVWLGYDTPKVYNKYGNSVTNSVEYAPLYKYPTPFLFHDIMAPLHEDLDAIPFLDSPDVIQQKYCVYTGNALGPSCSEVGTTWYKASNLPPICTGLHYVEEDDTETPVDPENDGGETVTARTDNPDPVQGGTGEVLDS